MAKEESSQSIELQIDPERPRELAVASYFSSKQMHHLESEHLDTQRLQGTFAGVFLPCLQSIIGIILFARLPWITGQAGVMQTMLILAVCVATTVLTSLSMSAIATNGKMPSGGSYYMIARSLGPAFGGSVGILYFFGEMSAAAMYILGAVEAILLGADYRIVNLEADLRVLGLILLLLLFMICFIGLKHVNRLAMAFLGALCLTLMCMYIGIFTAASRATTAGIEGLSSKNMSDNLGPYYSQSTSFRVLTALFYPSVTGILSGSNRSGDLKNPSRSIPVGTLAAVVASSFIYLSFVLLFGAVGDRDALVDNLNFVADVSWPSPYVVTVGVFLCTTGAALQMLASAPRVLNSIALDDLLPLGKFKDFNRSLYLTCLLAACVVSIGSLDAVAPISTMFFLLFYGFVNVACFLLSVLGNPSWRPTWPYYHWSTALVGSLLCFTIMVVISWWAALLAFVLGGILF
jgi:amino acid transporter